MNFEAIGVNFIAPALSSLTVLGLGWFAKTHLKSIQALENLEYRVEQNEQELNELSKRFRQMA